MRIAFVGKGGSGKTTMSSLFARALARSNKRVWLIDADINQHLGDAVGVDPSSVPTIASVGEKLRAYLIDGNALVASPDLIINSMTPSSGSKLLRPFELPDFLKTTTTESPEGVRFSRVGDLSEEDISVRCYHAKTSNLELLLNHLVDRDDEFVVCDMTAGVDAFSSSVFAQFDATFLAVEPTARSIDVLEAYAAYAAPFGITPIPIGSKLRDETDAAYIRQRLSAAPIASVPMDDEIRMADRDARPARFEMLSPATTEAIRELVDYATTLVPDRARRKSIADDVHRRNARAWGNARKGVDLGAQIDSSFIPMP